MFNLKKIPVRQRGENDEFHITGAADLPDGLLFRWELAPGDRDRTAVYRRRMGPAAEVRFEGLVGADSMRKIIPAGTLRRTGA